MQFVREIGKGGFGTVDLLQDINGNQLARKTFSINQPGTMHPDLIANVKKRFIREANIQSNLCHRNIVPVVDAMLEHNPPYLFMPLARSTLADDISSNRTLNGHYLEAIMDILAGLEELHSLGIYHRDLKPQNVLSFSPDSFAHYAIGDFGLISINDTQLSVLTTTGMRMGSDMYTAPEITSDLKKASVSSDLYSVGCILHDFIGTNERIPCNEVRGDQSLYADIISICTRRAPERRFSSVSDLRDAIFSVESNMVNPTTSTTVGLLERMNGGNTLDRLFCESFVSFLETGLDVNDKYLLFSSLTLVRIQEICTIDTFLGQRLANTYSEWIQTCSVPFSTCDGLANRLVCFFQNISEIEPKINVLLALLKLGTSHNRWYVEKEFVKLCDHKMDNRLAQRMSLEIRVLGREGCGMFTHLSFSIGAQYSVFHPSIFQTLNQVCNL